MAVNSSSLTTLSGLVHSVYEKPEKIQDVMISSGPFLAKLLKDADMTFVGLNSPTNILLGSGGGVGNQIATVSSYSSPVQSANFLLTKSSLWGVGSIGQQAVEASANAPEGSFLDDLVLETDLKFKRMLQEAARQMYNDGSGVLFQLGAAATVSNTYIFLDDPLLAATVQQGDVLQYSATRGGTPGDTGAVGYVLGVTLFGANAGQISVSSTYNGSATALNSIWPSIADGAYFVLAGNTAAAVSDGGVGPAVIQGVMSYANAASTNTFGVNVSKNPTFLAVQTIDCTSNTGALNCGTIRQSIITGVAQLASVSGKPSVAYVSPSTWWALVQEIQSQSMFNANGGTGGGDVEFGFSSLSLPTPDGKNIKVVADPFCLIALDATTYPVANGYSGANVCFLLEEDTIELKSMGKFGKFDSIGPDSPEGQSIFLRNGQGSYNYQISAFGQLAMHAPGHCAVLLLPAH